MSVLIRGVEMPSAGTCKTITIFDDGAVVEGNGSEKLGIAVPVPPHGDLIDRDAIISVAYRDKRFGGFWGDSMAIEYVEKCANNAPTIIPAEDGE